MFPNFPDKYEGTPIFSADDLIRMKKDNKLIPNFDMPSEIIICYQNRILDYIESNYEVDEIEGFMCKFYLINMNGHSIGIIGDFGIGSPIVASLMEEFNELGAKKFISLGLAGTLQKSINIGDIILCDKAIRDEGTSHHYLPHEKFVNADSILVSQIEIVLEDEDLDYVQGPTWTTDAPYKETIEEIKQYQSEGVLTVEMETAAVFALGRYYDLNTAALFIVSDSLANLEWDPKFDAKATTGGLEKIIEVAIKTLSNQ